MIQVVIAFACFPFAMWLRGYTLWYLWLWFATPHFGVQPPPIYALSGIALMGYVLIKGDTQEDKRDTPTQVAQYLAHAFCLPLLILGFAWIWHWLQWGL